MVIHDFGGDYLNAMNCKDGGIYRITAKPVQATIKAQGEDKLVLNVPVEGNDKEYTYTPAIKAGKALQDAFGEDSDEWVDKKFQTFNIDNKLVIKPLK